MAVNAYVLIEVTPGKTKAAFNAISKIAGVKSAHAVTGPYDIIALCEAADLKGCGDLVISKIRAVDGVTKTLTCVAIEI